MEGPRRVAREGSSSRGAKPGAGPLPFQLPPVPYDSGQLAQEFPAFPGTAFPPPCDIISHRCPARFTAAPTGRGRPHSKQLAAWREAPHIVTGGKMLVFESRK